MSRPLKCSVIIPTYNRAPLLSHTLESLVRQSLPADEFEVLVVDDGSSDETSVMVEGFSTRLNLRYFFQEDEGWRTARARNVGIANAAADVCVFLDSGLLAHSGCLAAHVSSHEESPVPLAVCGYVYGFNVDNQDADVIAKTIDYSDPDGSIDRMTGNPEWLDVREGFYDIYTEEFHDLPAPWIIFWTCGVSAPTALARSVGGFDEAFRSWGGEDLDFGYRLFNAGAKFILNRQASAIHCPHPKSFADNNQGAMANYRYMAEKYGTPIIRLLTEFPEGAPDDFTGFVTPFNLNDVIRERGLPSCAEYLARRGTAVTSGTGDAHE
jgi:glycosyltransferase involved in cell wall biosynthesis